MPEDPRITSPSGDSPTDSAATTNGRPPKPSRRWLYAALVASVLGVAVVIALVMGLLPSGWTASDSDSENSAVDTSGEELVVAIARTPGGPTEWSNWARVINQMSDELDTPVVVRYLSKEEEAPSVIASQDVDVAFVCAHQYLELRDDGVLNGLCSPIIDDDHMTTSMIVVRADDDAVCLEDLEGSVVAASDKSSLGGLAYLITACDAHDVKHEEYFSEVRVGESQEQNMHDLLGGQVRATVINSAQVAAWDLSGFKIVESSQAFGTPPVAVAADMDPELQDRIREFLVSFDSSTLPAESNISGFVELDDEDYAFAEVLRHACGDHSHP